MMMMMATTATTEQEQDWKDADFLTFQDNDEEDNDEEEGSNDKQVNGEARNIQEDDDSQLPPWMIQTPSVGSNPLVRLHNEIVDFCSLMEPKPQELLQRQNLVQRFQALALKCFPDAEVQVFGSQATGLLLPTSDIDVVILKNQSDEAKTEGKHKEKTEEDVQNWEGPASSSSSPLQQLTSALRDLWIDDLEYLEAIENTRVPLVKFTTTKGLSMDVSFDQPNGPKAAQLMKTYLQAMPPLRPLTFVLKYFLVSRGLHEPYSGGVGSYLLQLMIVSFLQHREREAYNNHRPSVYNLGCLLIEFLELYGGMDLNYITTGISVRHDGYYFPKGARDRKDVYLIPNRLFSLAMENPLDPSMDVGKPSFKIQTVARSFDVAFKVLLAHVTEPAIPATSILASILPPSPEMQKRMGKHKKEQPRTPDVSSPDRKRQRRV
jgi:non-canonical poly(A) RNA polymerase PAPD5/7